LKTNISTVWLLVAIAAMGSPSIGVEPAHASTVYGQAARGASSGAFTAGVQRRVTQDYPTIQAAIDASLDGDTVLVSEGKYMENIRYRGKAITVGSLYVIDGDTSHIWKTIIDGSKSTQSDSGSVVYFIHGEDTTSVLCGMTIQGGTGTRSFYHSYMGEFWMMAGGGVWCDSAGGRLINNVIARNRVISDLYPQGGGVCTFGRESFVPNVVLEGNRIVDNYVQATSDLAGATSFGGGACFIGTRARVRGNIFERDTIRSVIDAHGGGIAFIGSLSQTLWPEAYIAGNTFRGNVVLGSPGTAAGGGLVTWLTGNVIIRDNLFVTNTVTSAAQWACGGGLFVINGNAETLILNNHFLKNSVYSPSVNVGGGVSLYTTSATVSGNEIVENSVSGSGGGPGGGPGGGGGISASKASFRIENNIITRNLSAFDGGGILVSHGSWGVPEQVFINNTVVDNRAAQAGGGLRVSSAPGTVALNNIFWNDTATTQGSEVYVSGALGALAYCDVKGGYLGTGNIDLDPAFVAGDTMFNLKASSPCIGRGVDSIQIGGVWYHAPTCDCAGHLRPRPEGTHPDVGAQEDQTVLVGVTVRERVPVSYMLTQNYPNPFNPSTTIKFELPRSSVVRLSVYDILGREVSVLVNEKRDAGYHEGMFDGSGLSSGVYFCRMAAGSFVQTRKLILLR